MNEKVLESFQKISELSNDIENNIRIAWENNQLPEEIASEFSNKTFDRYLSLTEVLRCPYDNFLNKTNIGDGLLIQYWSTLGSHLEFTLQLFLSVYYKDFKESTKFIWSEDDIGKLNGYVEQISEDLQELQLENAVIKSFKKRVKEIIKGKSKIELSRVTLSVLIDFYSKEDVISKDFEKDDLTIIRDLRNNIHSFRNRDMGDWGEVAVINENYIKLLSSIARQLPELPDEISRYQ